MSCWCPSTTSSAIDLGGPDPDPAMHVEVLEIIAALDYIDGVITAPLPTARPCVATRRATPASLLEEVEAAANPAQLSAFQTALRRAGANIDRPESVFIVFANALGLLPSDVRAAIAPLGYLADAPSPTPCWLL